MTLPVWIAAGLSGALLAALGWVARALLKLDERVVTLEAATAGAPGNGEIKAALDVLGERVAGLPTAADVSGLRSDMSRLEATTDMLGKVVDRHERYLENGLFDRAPA